MKGGAGGGGAEPAEWSGSGEDALRVDLDATLLGTECQRPRSRMSWSGVLAFFATEAERVTGIWPGYGRSLSVIKRRSGTASAALTVASWPNVKASEEWGRVELTTVRTNRRDSLRFPISPTVSQQKVTVWHLTLRSVRLYRLSNSDSVHSVLSTAAAGYHSHRSNRSHRWHHSRRRSLSGAACTGGLFLVVHTFSQHFVD